ncbi:MAG: lipopolysaccharide biosynthesis protein, partial [Pseudomonadota bacterium]
MSDPILRRLARNTGWLLGGKAANAVLSLAVLAVAARALGPEGLGRLVLLQSLVQFTAEVAKFQSWQGVVRYGALALGGKGDLGRLVAFSLVLDGASAVAGLAFLVLAGPMLAAQLGWPEEVAALVPFYGTAVVFLVAGTATGLLRLFDRFDLLATQSALGNLIRLAGAVIAWAAGAGFE